MFSLDNADLSSLRQLSATELDDFANDIRAFLVQSVSKTGGHLGSNLGIVELTIAIHRVFESPTDRIVFDTGHQAYVHKIVTGRAADFQNLRQAGGLSGYPSRSESSHDIVENSHASTALSWAEGIAIGKSQMGAPGHVVAVVGDGSLTGGMAWEAINNIANKPELPLVIIVNDNGRSYSPTTGGLARHLDRIRTSSEYEGLLSWGKQTLRNKPFGNAIYRTLHALKRGLADATQTRGMFQDLGIKYIGPIDGHNVTEIETALRRARDLKMPVLVHVLTEKGRGYAPAELDEFEKFHGVGKFDSNTGIVYQINSATWTDIFRNQMIDLGRKDARIVGITAAMLGPTGLDKFAEEFPARIFDVGIAEQHAITSAAGMSFAGLKPVVAIYASFLNRAFDQLLLDAALHSEDVTVVLDRAGVTGDDGPSHNGIWDLSLAAMVPNLTLFAPWDATSLKHSLNLAVNETPKLKIVRFPKGALPPEVSTEPIEHFYYGDSAAKFKIFSIGAFVQTGIKLVDALAERGVKAELIAPLQVFPITTEVRTKLAEADSVVTLEDGIEQGGFGSAIAGLSDSPVEIFGVSQGFPDPAPRTEVLRKNGLEVEQIAEKILNSFSK